MSLNYSSFETVIQQGERPFDGRDRGAERPKDERDRLLNRIAKEAFEVDDAENSVACSSCTMEAMPFLTEEREKSYFDRAIKEVVRKINYSINSYGMLCYDFNLVVTLDELCVPDSVLEDVRECLTKCGYTAVIVNGGPYSGKYFKVSIDDKEEGGDASTLKENLACSDYGLIPVKLAKEKIQQEDLYRFSFLSKLILGGINQTKTPINGRCQITISNPKVRVPTRVFDLLKTKLAEDGYTLALGGIRRMRSTDFYVSWNVSGSR